MVWPGRKSIPLASKVAERRRSELVASFSFFMEALLILLLFLLFGSVSGYAYEIDSHVIITEQSIRQAGNYAAFVSNLNLSGGLWKEYINGGSFHEDDGFLFASRSKYHFYDPINGRGLNVSFLTAESSLAWGFNGGTALQTNDYSWTKARQHLYGALTAVTPTVRNEHLQLMFRSVGQVMHLVQDLASPAHVRNDLHLPVGLAGDLYEHFVLGEYDTAWANGYPAVELERFSDFWNGPRSLAEFTNHNFVSQSTNLDDFDLLGQQYYVSPQIDHITTQTEYLTNQFGVVVPVLVDYGGNTYQDSYTGETITNDRLTAFSIFNFEAQEILSRSVYSVNDFTMAAAADILVRRAVGYSAGLLNNFFRNDIEITPPERFVYGISADGSFTELRLKARNITTTGAAMSNGEIRLVIIYKQALEDPYRANLGAPVPTSAQSSSIVVRVANGVSAIPSDTPVELVFDLSGTPLPRLVTDVYIQVVYRGAWGSESDAVVVGYKDISEPTPLGVSNTMDYVCLNGHYLVAGSAEAFAAGDLNANGVIDRAEPDIYPHDLAEIYVRFSPVAVPRFASSSEYNAVFPAIEPAMYGRVWILSEYELAQSSQARFVNRDTRDEKVLAAIPETFPIRAVKNQQDLVEGRTVHYFSVLSALRGLPVWADIHYTNPEFPAGTVCDDHTIREATPALSGPVRVELR